MPNDPLVSVSVRGIKELNALFKRLPAALRKVIIVPVTEYIIGDDTAWAKASCQMAVRQSCAGLRQG